MVTADNLRSGRLLAEALQFLDEVRAAAVRGSPPPTLLDDVSRPSRPKVREAISDALDALGVPCDSDAGQVPDEVLASLSTDRRIAVIGRARRALTDGPEPYLY